jgi:hypothetical protein
MLTVVEFIAFSFEATATGDRESILGSGRAAVWFGFPGAVVLLVALDTFSF